MFQIPIDIKKKIPKANSEEGSILSSQKCLNGDGNFWQNPQEKSNIKTPPKGKIIKANVHELSDPVKNSKTPSKTDKPKKQSFFSTDIHIFDNIGINKEKDYFVENLSLLLDSGMGLVASLDAIGKEIKNKRLKQIIENLKKDINDGSSLSKSLAKTNLMPKHVLYLIKIGEQTGRLSENLKIIAEQEQKDRSFRSKIYSAIMYPVVVLGMTLVIGLGVAWFILPKLAQVFTDMKIKLPFVTKIMITIGEFLGNYGIIVVPLALVLVFVFIYMIFFYSKTKGFGEKILFAIPGINQLIQEVELARFGFILGTLLNAGVPIVESLNSLQEVATFPFYKDLYKYLKENIRLGNSFQKSFSTYPNSQKLIPHPVQQIITSGEQSGKLSDTLIRVGKNYEEKTDITTKNLATIIEPILLIIVWLGVAFVALAVIMPIYSLIGGFDQAASTPQKGTPPAVEEQANEDKGEVPDDKLHESANVQENNSIKPGNKKLEIVNTETGTLNVRKDPNTGAEIVAKVKPGETYEYSEAKDGWFKIIVSADISGWVSGTYTKVSEE